MVLPLGVQLKISRLSFVILLVSGPEPWTSILLSLDFVDMRIFVITPFRLIVFYYNPCYVASGLTHHINS